MGSKQADSQGTAPVSNSNMEEGHGRGESWICGSRDMLCNQFLLRRATYMPPKLKLVALYFELLAAAVCVGCCESVVSTHGRERESHTHARNAHSIEATLLLLYDTCSKPISLSPGIISHATRTNTEADGL